MYWSVFTFQMLLCMFCTYHVFFPLFVTLLRKCVCHLWNKELLPYLLTLPFLNFLILVIVLLICFRKAETVSVSRCCRFLCYFCKYLCNCRFMLQMPLHSDWQHIRYYLIKMSRAPTNWRLPCLIKHWAAISNEYSELWVDTWQDLLGFCTTPPKRYHWPSH